MQHAVSFMQRLAFLWPEIALFVTTCVVMVLGLSRAYAVRKASAVAAAVGLFAALLLSIATTPGSQPAICPFTGTVFSAPVEASGGQLLLPDMARFAKATIAAVGLLLLLLMAGTVDRADEAAIAKRTRAFDPLRSNRAEFYAFLLFSLTGLMLCADADDLIWLFLALELTSLPTYIMVAMSTARNQSREAGVKYFFLGALGAALFLYGFALIYGACGTTNLNAIAGVFAAQGMSTLALAGVMLALVGLGFKIAAVPMHFYTPDVYQGAAPQVSAFLAFVPKTAGFLGILLLCAAAGWSYIPGHSPIIAGEGVAYQALDSTFRHLPEPIRLLLWVMAALTMTVGNVLALLQTSVKRMLAYSSIAHSGYMLVGVIAGPNDGSFTQSGIAAVLFYLMAYGVTNTGAFAVLAALERSPGPDGEPREIEHVDDLRGLCSSHPALGWTMVVCCLSLLGLPPLLGFLGKLPLFTSAIASSEYVLVVILGLNSAVAAFYYLRLAFTPLLEKPEGSAEAILRAPFRSRGVGAVVSAGGVIVLAFAAGLLAHQAARAGKFTPAGQGPSEEPADQVSSKSPDASVRRAAND